MLLIQFLLSFKYPITSFILPYLAFFMSVVLFNLTIKVDPNNEIADLMRNHAAEHLVSERMWFNKDTIYSWGCSNSHIIFTFILNLILFTQLPVVPAYILSNFIAGEVIFWMLFHQETKLAKLFYPLMVAIQNLTLLPPKEHNMKLAEITLNKLRELENSES